MKLANEKINPESMGVMLYCTIGVAKNFRGLEAVNKSKAWHQGKGWIRQLNITSNSSNPGQWRLEMNDMFPVLLKVSS
jgi:hypothetical protein